MRLTTLPLLVLCLTVVGCAGSKDTSPSVDTGAGVDAMAKAVPIVAEISGDQLPIENYSVTIVDRGAYDQLNLAPMFEEAGVQVDPAKHSIVLLSLGQQDTAGYKAEITALQLKGNLLFVQGTAAAPAEDSQNAQQITYPFSAVAVEKLPAEVTVRSDITSLP